MKRNQQEIEINGFRLVDSISLRILLIEGKASVIWLGKVNEKSFFFSWLAVEWNQFGRLPFIFHREEAERDFFFVK